MVLCLKARESRSPPGLPIHPYLSPKAGFITTIAGWSSPVARQAHNLKVIGSNPIPATKSTPVSHHRKIPPRMHSPKSKHVLGKTHTNHITIISSSRPRAAGFKPELLQASGSAEFPRGPVGTRRPRSQATGHWQDPARFSAAADRYGFQACAW